MKSKLKKILDNMHEYNAGNLAQLTFGATDEIIYERQKDDPSRFGFSNRKRLRVDDQ